MTVLGIFQRPKPADEPGDDPSVKTTVPESESREPIPNAKCESAPASVEPVESSGPKELAEVVPEPAKTEEANENRPEEQPPLQLDLQTVVDRIDGLVRRVENIMDGLIAENRELIARQDKIDEKLHLKEMLLEEVNQNVQQDQYRKGRLSLAKQIMRAAETMRLNLYKFEKTYGYAPGGEPKDEETKRLKGDMEGMVTILEGILETEHLKKRPMSEPGTPFDPEFQEVTGEESTDDEALVGKVCRSLGPAWVWQLPYILKPMISETGDKIRHYSFLVRPEQVIVYKLNDQNK